MMAVCWRASLSHRSLRGSPAWPFTCWKVTVPPIALIAVDLEQAGGDQVGVLLDLVAGESADGVQRIGVDR